MTNKEKAELKERFSKVIDIDVSRFSDEAFIVLADSIKHLAVHIGMIDDHQDVSWDEVLTNLYVSFGILTGISSKKIKGLANELR